MSVVSVDELKTKQANLDDLKSAKIEEKKSASFFFSSIFNIFQIFEKP